MTLYRDENRLFVDHYRLLRDTTRTASKDLQCGSCAGTIRKGSTYNDVALIDSWGKFSSYIEHQDPEWECER